MSTNLEYRANERESKRETGRQAGEAEPEKRRQTKNKGDIFCWKNNTQIL